MTQEFQHQSTYKTTMTSMVNTINNNPMMKTISNLLNELQLPDSNMPLLSNIINSKLYQTTNIPSDRILFQIEKLLKKQNFDNVDETMMVVYSLYKRLVKECGDNEEVGINILIFVKNLIEENKNTTTGTSFSSEYISNNKNEHDHKIKESSNNHNNTIQKEEKILISECIYSLQGTNGDHISINPTTTTPTTIHKNSLKSLLPNNKSKQRLYFDAIHICCECSYMYTTIQLFIQTIKNNSNSSILRAFASSLSNELIEYIQLISNLESLILNEKEVFTISKLTLWLYQPQRRLKTMLLLVQDMDDDDSSRNGLLLLDSFYLHTLHGDERHVTLVNRILSKSSIPFYTMLYEWIVEGSTSNDFFIIERQESMMSSHDIWFHKFIIVNEYIPRFISNALANDILTAGKGIYFIRNCLNDKEFMILSELSDNLCSTSELGFYYGNESKIHTQVQSYLTTIHEHILQAITNNHKLLDHLTGIKQIILLQQGDFVSMLLQMSYEELNKDVSKVYTHNLIDIVDNALRSSNARYLPIHVLDKILVVLKGKKDEFASLDNNPKKKDESQEEIKGYNAFTLDYDVSNTPLSSIIHPKATQQYQKIFHFIWKLKHLEFILNLSWKESKAVQYSLWKEEKYKSPGFFLYKRHDKSSSTITSDKQKLSLFKIESLLRKMDIIRQEMLLFTTNMQSYIMLEVIENGWKKMIIKINKAKTLDDILVAHDMFLSDILTKSLLLDENTTTDTTSNNLSSQLKVILDIANRFCLLQTQVIQSLQSSLNLSADRRVEAERRISKGKWGYENDIEQHQQEEILWYNHPIIQKNVLPHVDGTANEFNTSIKTLLTMLNDKMNSNNYDSVIDGDLKQEQHYDNNFEALRFLMFRLDFSEHYYKP